MELQDLPLPPAICDHLRGEGIERLYPPQAAAVEAGVVDGENVVAAIPTASGKTLVAELAMVTADGPSLYMCPLRALAREKHETFDALPGVDAGLATGEYDSAAEELAANDVVVATSEKVDSAIRNGASWIDALACVVVDEVHLVESPSRGATLEVTVAMLRRRAPEAQLVALSATVANPAAIADWLDAELVESDWRPIDLRTGVYADGRVGFDDGSELVIDGWDRKRQELPADEREGATDDPTRATVAQVADAEDGAGQALPFVRSRR
ncbi:MAG: DEAD/DEAH box helicase, partial [Haloferacaceae archaeon]